MDNLRIFATVLIVILIATLSLFQMQLRGFEKIGRMEEWVLYIEKDEKCPSITEIIYTDEVNNYLLPCKMSHLYVVKSGFEEKELIYALEENLISIEELELLIDIIIEEK